MYLKTKGLILRTTAYNDTDSMLTLLSAEQGKLTVKAKWLRKRNSTIAAPCELLAYGDFTLFSYKGALTVNEATSIELFTPLRDDLVKLSLGTYFAQVADVVSQEDVPDPELLSLVLNCLHALSYLQVSAELVKAVFEMRIACIAGYLPDLSKCCICGSPTPDRFDTTSGLLVCSHCGGSSGIRMPITPGILDCMRYLCRCDRKRLFSFRADEHTVTELSHITEAYLLAQLERGFSTLDFYKSLIYLPDT